ncbi:MAG: OmpH family outer membrane protein [Acidobacteriota bacterium]|nr:OmpH family outer membrane protein [Acidobacteriota bacterium]
MNAIERPAQGRVAVIAAVLWLGVWGAGALPAQEFSSGPSKVAVIDVRRILTESESGRAAIERLRVAAKAKQDALEAQGDAAVAIEQDLEARRLSLSEDKQQEIEADLQRRAIELRRAQDDARREIEELQTEEFKTIEDRVMPLIQEIGESEGFTLIFNKFEESGLLFAAPGADITDKVLERFNALPEG